MTNAMLYLPFIISKQPLLVDSPVTGQLRNRGGLYQVTPSNGPADAQRKGRPLGPTGPQERHHNRVRKLLGQKPITGCPSILCRIIGDCGRLVGSSRREIGGLRSKRPNVVPNNGALWTPHDLSSGELGYLIKSQDFVGYDSARTGPD